MPFLTQTEHPLIPEGKTSLPLHLLYNISIQQTNHTPNYNGETSWFTLLTSTEYSNFMSLSYHLSVSRFAKNLWINFQKKFAKGRV